jgi:hypothetical protein
MSAVSQYVPLVGELLSSEALSWGSRKRAADAQKACEELRAELAKHVVEHGCGYRAARIAAFE